MCELCENFKKMISEKLEWLEKSKEKKEISDITYQKGLDCLALGLAIWELGRNIPKEELDLNFNNAINYEKRAN